MCPAFLTDSRFYQFLFRIDQEIAAQVQAEGCPHCGGALHSACYPRKPRGLRGVLDESYQSRFEFLLCRGRLSAAVHADVGAFSRAQGLFGGRGGVDQRPGTRSVGVTPAVLD